MGKDRDPVWEEWLECMPLDGKKYAECKYCSRRLQANAARFKQHIVQTCPKAPENIKAKYRQKVSTQSVATPKQKLILQSLEQKSNTQSIPMILPTTQEETSSIVCINDEHCEPLVKKKCTTMASFVDSVSPHVSNALDLLWAKACYTNQWAFNCMNNPFLGDFFQQIRPGWKPPSAFQISHGLLDATVAEVEGKNYSAITQAANITLMLDGWSDVNRSSLVNISIYAGKPIFLKSLDPSMSRHNAQYIADAICNVIEIQSVTEKTFRSVVTDQPTVMTAAWRIVEQKKPWIHCYGCAGHVINLLASDFRKIKSVSANLEQNKKIAIFFKSHCICKELLSSITKEKYSKSLKTILSCVTRWSTDYFMIRRNLRIQGALVSAVIDERIAKEVRVNGEIRNIILQDDCFWPGSQSSACLLKPLTTGIQHCEGDHVSLSVMPHIWAHITSQLNPRSLSLWGFDEDEIGQITQYIDDRRGMNLKAITFAAHALDPRFYGAQLSDEEWNMACEFIVKMSEVEGLNRRDVLNDITEYRSKSGTVFGKPLIWEAALSPSCSRNPECWWKSFLASRPLCKIAVILLSMPATAAMVERCNKAYSGQKVKIRNRLIPERAAKLAMVSYNLKIQKSSLNPSTRAQKRNERLHILFLSTKEPTETVPSSEGQGPEELASNAMKPILEEDEMSDTDSQEQDSDIGEVLLSDGTEEDSVSNESDDEDVSLASITLMKGDWVAVKLTQVDQHGITRARSQVFMHLARIEEIEDTQYSVSFLKRQSDNSYCWPDLEDVSLVSRAELVKISDPSEDILSRHASVRIKLVFSKIDIDGARKLLNIPPGNIR